MTEILFIVEEAAEAGYVAHAVDASITTEADDLDQLREMVAMPSPVTSTTTQIGRSSSGSTSPTMK